MRQYVVQPGDSPASIAAKDDHAGCPKCAKDLIESNGHKEAVTLPNGFKTFKTMTVGEVLNLPDKWFDGSMDDLPRSYFELLPSADGVTMPPRFGLSGPPFGLGDALSDNGLSAQAAGQYAFNASGLGDNLPPDTTTQLEPYASGAASFGGMTEQQQTVFAEELSVTLASAIATAVGGPWAGTAIGALLQAAFQAAGLAQGGAGCCGPKPDASQPYGTCPADEFSWSKNEGPFTDAPDGTFEHFFYQVALADWKLVARCWTTDKSGTSVSANWSQSVSEARLPGLLIAAVAAWNKTHLKAGTAKMVPGYLPGTSVPVYGSGGTVGIPRIVNTKPQGSGFSGLPGSTDPLGVALNAVGMNAGVPLNSTLYVTVNNGPPIGVGDTGTKGGVQAINRPTSSTASTIVTGTVVVAAAGAAGIGIYAYATKQAFGAAAKHLWKKATGDR